MNKLSAADMVTEARRGSHHCLFYKSQDDLVNLLSEYIKSGIEKGEFCIWVTADGGVEDKARRTVGNKLPGRNVSQTGSQIEFIPYSDWYLSDGSFHPEQVLNAWVERLKLALSLGYRGLRVTGDLGWLDATDWQTLMGYETDINSVIDGQNFMAVCSYPLPKINASQMIDVIDRHQVALGKNNGQWRAFKGLPPDAAVIDENIHAVISDKQGRGNKTSTFPVLFPENCNGCGDCVSVCSGDILYLSKGRIAMKATGECDWCTYCEAVCLSNAVFCPFEISSADQTDT
jgi:ferredoxin